MFREFTIEERVLACIEAGLTNRKPVAMASDIRKRDVITIAKRHGHRVDCLLGNGFFEIRGSLKDAPEGTDDWTLYVLYDPKLLPER